MKKPAWICPGCGSNKVEALAWVRLNNQRVVSWDENSEYWCPRCERHYKRVCQVDESGRCLMHHQPIEKCREAHRPQAGGAQ
jgi:hypothetical protein